jgi:outer membrane protein TolC
VTGLRAAAALAVAAVLASGPTLASGTLTLEQAIESAVENNEDVQILEEHVVKARAVRLQVLSGLLPWLGATASYGFTEEVALDMGGGESRVVVPGKDWGWGVSASLKLLNLGLIPSVSAAGKGVEAADALLEYGRDEVAYATAQAYVTVLFARAAVEVKERLLETRAKRREEVEELLGADEALVLDLKRAELQELQAQQSLEAARVDVDLALDALCLIMGEKPGGEYDLAPLEQSVTLPATAPDEQQMLVDIDEALEERDDLEAKALALSSAKSSKVSGWLDLLPTLSFSATYDQGPKSFRAPNGFTWYVSFNMSWTLFDGGYTAGKIKEASATAAEALLDVTKAGKEVESEVRSAWLLFKLGLTNRETAAKQLEVASAGYEMAEERYKAGLATGLEVEDALDALAEAEMGLLGQEMSLELAWLGYLRASGQFGEFFEVES